MQARLLKDSQENLRILCSDGTIIDADKNHLNRILTGFHTIDKLGGGEERWDAEYPEMSLYPGYDFAYVTDNFQLVLSDFNPFKQLFDVDYSVLNLITAAEYGKQNGKSVEQIKVLCRNGRITGATKIGRDWMIPADAPYPTDGRYAFRGRRGIN